MLYPPDWLKVALPIWIYGCGKNSNREFESDRDKSFTEISEMISLSDTRFHFRLSFLFPLNLGLPHWTQLCALPSTLDSRCV